MGYGAGAQGRLPLHLARTASVVRALVDARADVNAPAVRRPRAPAAPAAAAPGPAALSSPTRDRSRRGIAAAALSARRAPFPSPACGEARASTRRAADCCTALSDVAAAAAAAAAARSSRVLLPAPSAAKRDPAASE